MAAIGYNKYFLSTLESPPVASVGTWAQTLASNITSFNHTAAAESAVTAHPVPKILQGYYYSGSLVLAKIAVIYSVATAALSAAPTAVLDQNTSNASTRVVSRAAVAQTLAFTGSDTTGITAGGTFAAEVSITTTVALPQTDTFLLEMTWPCAATSVLKIFGVELYFQG